MRRCSGGWRDNRNSNEHIIRAEEKSRRLAEEAPTAQNRGTDGRTENNRHERQRHNPQTEKSKEREPLFISAQSHRIVQCTGRRELHARNRRRAHCGGARCIRNTGPKQEPAEEIPAAVAEDRQIFGEHTAHICFQHKAGLHQPSATRPAGYFLSKHRKRNIAVTGNGHFPRQRKIAYMVIA